MSKSTWRAERLRSADVRRNVYQRAAESARKRYITQKLKEKEETRNGEREDNWIIFMPVVVAVFFLLYTTFCGGVH